MKSPVKMSDSESIVKSYRLFEAKQSFFGLIVNLFITNKRIVVSEETRTLLGKAKRVHEYDVKEVVDVYTNIEEKVDLIPTIISTIITIILIALIGATNLLWIWIIAFSTSIALGINAFLNPKSRAVLKLKVKATGVVATEITSKTRKLFDMNNVVFNYANVKRCKDFETVQYEIGSVIRNVKESKIDFSLEETSQNASSEVESEKFDEIPEI